MCLEADGMHIRVYREDAGFLEGNTALLKWPSRGWVIVEAWAWQAILQLPVLRCALSPQAFICWDHDEGKPTKTPFLVSFSYQWHSLELHERIPGGWGGASLRSPCGHVWEVFSWLLIDTGGLRPLCLWLSPELCKKGSWVISLHSSCPCSCLHSCSVS